MKKFTGAGIALLLGTTAAYAGGLDRSGQSITALFEEGTYAEISFGSVSPDVTGTGINAVPPTNPAASTGNMAGSYIQLGLAYKTDLNDQWSLALIMDNPFGVNVDYNSAGYVLVGTNAEVKSNGITILGQYHINENMSVFAGPRMVTASGEYHRRVTGNALANYDVSYASDMDIGYVVGGAYEITDIALRAALTYSSATEFSMEGSGAGNPLSQVGNMTAKMPQSVNLDFQTGVAANTLAFANIRWADWSEASLDDSVVGNLADFNDSDVTTYTVGIGRRFTDNFAAQIAVSYEKDTGESASNLSPTDGYISYSIGGAYTLDNGLEISGGVRFVDLGDANADSLGAPLPGATFTDNSATAIGLKLAYNY